MEGWGLFSDKMAEAPAPQQFPRVLCSLGPGALAHVLPRAPVSPTLPACQFLAGGITPEPTSVNT